MITLIAAVAENQTIGLDNRLPWKIPADLARFKRLTMGHVLIMGRKTFDSIGRPLPGRTTIVLTRQSDFLPQGVTIASSVQESIQKAGSRELFIAGGAEIYRQFLPLADRLSLTLVHQSFQGDTFFPTIEWNDWVLAARQINFPDHRNPYKYSFVEYRRSVEAGR